MNADLAVKGFFQRFSRLNIHQNSLYFANSQNSAHISRKFSPILHSFTADGDFVKFYENCGMRIGISQNNENIKVKREKKKHSLRIEHNCKDFDQSDGRTTIIRINVSRIAENS